MLTLVYLGLLARIRETEVLVRWSRANWHLLREPLGFDRDNTLGEFERRKASKILGCGNLTSPPETISPGLKLLIAF